VAFLLISILGCSKREDASQLKEVGTFYLRACGTGRLIGPIDLTPGHSLPSLEEQAYIVAEPAKSELTTRRRLLETKLYQSHQSIQEKTRRSITLTQPETVDRTNG